MKKQKIKTGEIIAILVLLVCLYFSTGKAYAVSVPTVTTQPASYIATTSATGNATILDDGGEDLTREIQWGITSGVYTHSCLASSGSVGDYTCDMTELSLDTKYYYRAKATNSAGTSYGSERSFTTNVAYQAFQRKILDMADIGVMKISDDEFYVTGTSGGHVIRIYKTTDLENFTLYHTFDPSAIDETYDYCDVMGPDLALTGDSNVIISFSAVRVAKEAVCPEVVNSVKTIYQSSRTSAIPWTFSAPYALQYVINGTPYGTDTGRDGEEVFKLAPMVRGGRIYYTWFDGGNNISSIGLTEPHDLVNHTNGKDFPDEFIHEGSTVFERNGLSYFSFNRYNWMESYTQSYMYGNSGVTNLVRSPGESVLDMAEPIHTFGCALNDISCIYENAGGGDFFSRNGQYYFMYHKAFPRKDRMKRSAYLTPIYFDTDGRIISITNTILNWANMGSGMEYSLAIKPVGQNWIAPCIGAGIIGSNTTIEFGGLCQTAGDVVVHKGEVAQFRICYSDDNWVSSKCGVINNDVTRDSLFVDLSSTIAPSAPTSLHVL